MTYLKYISVFIATAFLSVSALATPYEVDYAQSSLSFSGTHAGDAFEGEFEDWAAEIIFDENNLAESSLTATFATDSAKTGNNMYDGTLPQADWFDSRNHPEAVFQSTEITASNREEGTYTVTGNLTIRGITQPVTFDFNLSDLTNEPVTAQATLSVKRLDFGIGEKSDPTADWVSEDIQIDIQLLTWP